MSKKSKKILEARAERERADKAKAEMMKAEVEKVVGSSSGKKRV